MLPGKGLLSSLQRAFLAEFARLPDHEQFYLAGGTALAEYYLGHRLSFDLDLFTGQAPLILPQSYQIEAMAGRTELRVAVNRRFASYVEFTISQGAETPRGRPGAGQPVSIRAACRDCDGHSREIAG